ncbi:hypothetical protein TcG_10319 [Trypanosoma cruzi]|nr:hypothetical protein TcG_10319 [Trypanosoma cruzi]
MTEYFFFFRIVYPAEEVAATRILIKPPRFLFQISHAAVGARHPTVDCSGFGAACDDACDAIASGCLVVTLAYSFLFHNVVCTDGAWASLVAVRHVRLKAQEMRCRCAALF